MSFFNIPFLLYFLPAFLALYYFLYVFHKPAVMKACLLLGSLAFLLWLEPLLLPLFLILVPVNYGLGLFIKNAFWEKKRAKPYLWSGYIINGGIFLMFQLIGALITHGLPFLNIQYTIFRTMLLPAGISVFTLRAISYISDIYSGDAVADKNILNVGLYLCFFSQIVVGPLVSYESFQPQLNCRFNKELLFDGINRIAIGLAKKILLAGNLAVVSDKVFALSKTSDSLTQVPASLAWLGILAFFLQVYYDFTAYTDFAIGLSNILGFSAPENFNYPYMAKSITEFWNRWFITLKKWFDRYISRPLNKYRYENNDHMIINTFIAFVAMGIWHKASIGMLVFAFLQVLCIAVERVITYDQRRIPALIRHAYVILILLMSWSLFRYGNFYETLLFLRNMFGLNQNGLTSSLALAFIKEYWVFFAAAILFIFPVAPRMRSWVERSGKGVRAIAAVLYPLMLSGIVWLCLMYIARGLYTPVQYFSF